MNKKELIALGVEDEELAQKIIVLHGKNIEKFKGEVAGLTEEKDALVTQLAEAGEKIESFASMDIEAVKAEAAGWQTKAEEAEAARVADVAKLKFEHRLEASLSKAKAKNLKAVKALLNLEELKLAEDGESISGLDTQLETIAEENDYLFDSPEPDPEPEEETTPRVVAGAKGKSILGDTAVQAAREGAGLTKP